MDAVSIALPSDVQVPLAVPAARAGRHLLLEKPLALFASGADELLGVVTEACVVSVVFFTSRFTLGPAAEVAAVQGQHQTSHVLVRHAGGAVSALAVSLVMPR